MTDFEGREQRHSQYFDNNFDVQVDPDPVCILILLYLF